MFFSIYNINGRKKGNILLKATSTVQRIERKLNSNIFINSGLRVDSFSHRVHIKMAKHLLLDFCLI